MRTPTDPVVTRFAPSPTGHLHVGGARTALLCWAFARRERGRFLLRIEDTDLARSSEEAAAGILADLAWLGIDWDDGPVFEARDGRTIGGDERGVGPFYQSQRLETYQRFLDQLIERDLAYPAFDTPEELEAMRGAAQEAKRTFRYVRDPAYDRDAMLARAAGEPHVVRFRAPDETIRVRDELLGEIEFTTEHFDDFVIRKRDGMPTYHFAVVVDDELMGVTHVIRGQEHLNNTPKHAALQMALVREDGSGFRVPSYCHLPLIFNPDGSKMSKRDKDKAAREACKAAGVSEPPAGEIPGDRFAAWLKHKKSQLETGQLRALARTIRVDLPEIDVEDFRASGYLPEAVVNYLALLGWNPKTKNPDGTDLERFDAGFLAERFGFEGLSKAASKFDRAKLLAFNADSIQAMEPGAFRRRWAAWLAEFDPGALEALGGDGSGAGDLFAIVCAAAQPRARTWSDAREPVRFALIGDEAVEFDEGAVGKALRKGEPSGLEVLGRFAGEIDRIEPFEPEGIESAVKAWCEGEGIGMGKVAQPLRVALTGTTVSPPLGQTLAILGKERVRRRVERCLGAHG
ncbi:MAG: glutamate--tRNA ligase [Phycisphaerales bacterium JB037]